MNENKIESHLDLRIKKRASQRFSTGLAYLIGLKYFIFTASEALIKFTEDVPKKVKLNEEQAAIRIQRQWRVRCEKKKYLKEINEEFFVSETLRVEKMEKQLESIKFDMEMEAYMLELEDLGTVSTDSLLFLSSEGSKNTSSFLFSFEILNRLLF